MGITNAVFAVSSVLGPLIDKISWKWAFFINLPLGFIAVIIIIVYLKTPTPAGSLVQKLKRVDFPGTILIMSFATLFLLALNFGGITFPWTSAPVIVCLVIAVSLVVVLALVELKHAIEPVIPSHLFKIRTIAATYVVQWFFGMVFNAVVIEMPLFLQTVRGDSATVSGLRLIILQAAIFFSGTLSGYLISRFNHCRSFLTTGMVFLTVGVGLMSLLSEQTSNWLTYGSMFVFGIGAGCMFTCAIIAEQSACDPKDLAIATSLGSFFQILGGAVGVGEYFQVEMMCFLQPTPVCSTTLNNSLISRLSNVLPSDLVLPTIRSTAFLRENLTLTQQHDAIACYVRSFAVLWYVLIPCAGLAFVASLFLQTQIHSKKATVVENDPAIAKNPTSHLSESDDWTVVNVLSEKACDGVNQVGVIATDNMAVENLA
ncbi:major facilitator superfamily domain-containing protein [Endogone sp. FLAS-F59071]|nr:major facilitator superfamily domain-containing protein [Endogone sp. FLAS-F59071]|eukprot:RUS20177.1 major facilitator superfamily domain-containing protein [Endogone sp. FLAS-F59071]